MSSAAARTFRLIPGIGLGDSLLFLPAALALVQKGHQVIIHSRWLEAFKDVLPFTIGPSVDYRISKQELSFNLQDLIFIQNHSPACNLLQDASIQIVGHSRFQGHTQAQEIFQALAGQVDQGPYVKQLRALLLPKAPKPKSRSLALHPLSHHLLKNWPLEKFLFLAKHFSDKGWSVSVFGSSSEDALLKPFEGIASVQTSLPIHALMHTLAEHELFVGNDSGLGHLASLAGRPTFSLFKSKSHGSLWRPAWAANHILTPCIPLPATFRDQLWKSCLLTCQVLFSIYAYLKHSCPIKNHDSHSAS
jgi:hypothetical protein